MPRSGPFIGGRLKSYVTTEVSGDPAGGDPAEIVFETFTLTSALAGTAVSIVPDARVGSGRRFYLLDFGAKVNGGTNWGTTATVKLQDTAASDFVTLPVASLTGNAEVGKFTSGVGEDALLLGSGGGLGKGLQVKGDVNGTGSDLKGWVLGVIR